MLHRTLLALAHVPYAVRRSALAAMLLLSMVSAGYARHVHRQFVRLQRGAAETERELASARATVRQRDAALAHVRDRADTVFVPVTRYVAASVPQAATSRDTVSSRTEIVLPTDSIDALRGAPAHACVERNVAALPPRMSDSIGLDAPPRRAFHALLTPRAPRMLAANAAYFGILATADLGNAWLHIDRDPGGYLDVWNTQDKLAHGAMGAVLSMAAIDAGVRPPWAVALTCAGAAGFEWSQGYASRKDLIAGCAGAALGAGIQWGASKLTGRTR